MQKIDVDTKKQRSSQSHQRPTRGREGAEMDEGWSHRPDVQEALRQPFDIVTDTLPLLWKADESSDVWEWGVFANCAPGKSLLATYRSLCRKVTAARAVDDLEYYEDGVFVWPHDLQKRAGTWPDSEGSPDFESDGFIHSHQRHRLVLCSLREPVGFCTLEAGFKFLEGDDVPRAEIEIRSVFLDPRWRRRGLSELFVLPAASIMVNMLRAFQARLVESGATEKFGIPLNVTGAVISDAGWSFLSNVADQISHEIRQAPVVAPNGQAVFHVSDIQVFDPL